jgi:acyl carrier protein
MQKHVEVTAESNIGRDLGVDSLALMNIVMELEDVFELSIPIDRLADVETVGDLAALINELRARG